MTQWHTTPAYFDIVATDTCRHCRRAIEHRQTLGGIHANGLFLCAVPDPTRQLDPRRWTCATPTS